MSAWQWIVDMLRAWRDSFDIAEEDWSSSFPATPDDIGCPDTQPTSPGALDSDLGRLE